MKSHALLPVIALAFALPLFADEPTAVSVGPYVSVSDNTGDTWAPAWTRDNRVFTPSDDSAGFGHSQGSNVHFNEVFGDDPHALTGTSINPLLEYGGGGTVTGPEKRTWKSSGCTAVDGVLYLVVARHNYANRQDAKDASIIKSSDGGKTWTRSAQENHDHPMFPGPRFSTPYFIVYGQDGKEPVADQSDKYVYALSNNGFWDNGDNMILGRVLRSKIGNLDGKDWQFYQSGDGSTDAAWTSDMNAAKPVIDRPDKLGMGGPVYVPKWKCYLMVDWFYTAGGGRANPTASQTAQWDFLVAQHPWGPWKMIKGSHTFHPEGFYGAQVCPKFTSADGNTVWAFTSGDFGTFQKGPKSLYHLFLVPLTLK